jgi:hypothetical protein
MQPDGRPDRRYEADSRSSHCAVSTPKFSPFCHTYVPHTIVSTNNYYFPKQYKIATNTNLIMTFFVLIYFLPTFRRMSFRFLSIIRSQIKIVNMVLSLAVKCCEEISRGRFNFRLRIGNATDLISKIELRSGQCGYFTVRNPTFRFIDIFQSLCL